MIPNTTLALAAEFVHFTNKNIFLTGKAGTGKTTFLHNLKKTLHKRMAIVAPTGVAAINAGGVTIHSFFQLPFGPHIPGSFLSAQQYQKFSREKINLIKSLDLLVIDEISMVRADMLDGIDEVLRRYKDREKPFGGVQLLMIGDLHQLSPVIKDEEWSMLKEHYDTIFFFSSHALQKSDPVRIELTHIYRQSDDRFIDLLNHIRENRLDADTLAYLNQRYLPDFVPADDEGYITLTTHNSTAQEINHTKLKTLPGEPEYFEAKTDGDFPEYSYPTNYDLSLKTGAQVMFVKNDSSRDKLFYNGKIGFVSRIDSGTIYVKCKGEYAEIPVKPEEWTNVKYVLNQETKEIDEQVIGSFTQFPLKLAWAITIHKSQGLTFEKAIIDAKLSFAHGQVYVALSRCKSYEGMVLRSPIGERSVITDGAISVYTKEVSKNQPDSQRLESEKISFQQSLIYELFDFSALHRNLFQLDRVLSGNTGILDAETIRVSKQLLEISQTSIQTVAQKFRSQLSQLFLSGGLPEENSDAQVRIQKASAYFLEKTDLLTSLATEMNLDTDNQAVRKLILEAFENFQKSVFLKHETLITAKENFNTAQYLRVKANADIEFKLKVKTSQKAPTTTGKGLLHNDLYKTIKEWRDQVADQKNVPVYIVMPQKAIKELTEKLPSTPAELESIKGIGKTKVRQYGSQVLDMINTYCEENGIERQQTVIAPVKKAKPDTKAVSLEMFREGVPLEKIAEDRGLSVSTIESHLHHYIAIDELDIRELYPAEKVSQITDFFTTGRSISLSEAKTALGDDFSYSEIRGVLLHLRKGQD
ncbi:ATP-dependent RecD-like DNA helicase [Dyadobacter sp. CECT 9275]|uniref:ATP-dependent RecD-like DNA helicase n=1 Tax=Dyadobacter helix TaxID=2822344 RepID=A0A916JGS5_9BACT|nr:helix-turn-helix domain-containing protein [Dyadobacter sp. CECT 9275]CAG5012687.1 ATP-dependent RecD-like DNA helicase [Dyadobacter sp. CECT 9275]